MPVRTCNGRQFCHIYITQSDKGTIFHSFLDEAQTHKTDKRGQQQEVA